MRTKIWVAIMALLALTYVILFGARAITLLSDSSVIGKVIGFLMLVFPVVAIWSIWIELRFGFAAEKLSRQLADENFPELALEFRPSGKATAESAKIAFESAKQEAEQNRENWRYWFRLGEAYEACGDRRRARAAIRQAIALAANNS